jgi:hypothetical protein
MAEVYSLRWSSDIVYDGVDNIGSGPHAALQEWVLVGVALAECPVEAKGQNDKPCIAVRQPQQTSPETVLRIGHICGFEARKPLLCELLEFVVSLTCELLDVKVLYPLVSMIKNPDHETLRTFLIFPSGIVGSLKIFSLNFAMTLSSSL